jgi:hypothetical protein
MSLCSARSSMKARLMRNCRPASVAWTSPLAAMSSSRSLEQPGDVGRVAGRGDGHHRARLRHLGRRREHGGAAEAVADEDRRRLRPAAQFVRGRDQIADVGGKRRVGKLAFARAEPGEVEAQHGDAERGEPFGHALGGVDVLAAGKAVRKQRVGARLAGGTIEQRGKVLPLGIGKIEALGRHALLPFHNAQSTAGFAPTGKRGAPVVRAPAADLAAPLNQARGGCD